MHVSRISVLLTLLATITFSLANPNHDHLSLDNLRSLLPGIPQLSAFFGKGNKAASTSEASVTAAPKLMEASVTAAPKLTDSTAAVAAVAGSEITLTVTVTATSAVNATSAVAGGEVPAVTGGGGNSTVGGGGNSTVGGGAGESSAADAGTTDVPKSRLFDSLKLPAAGGHARR